MEFLWGGGQADNTKAWSSICPPKVIVSCLASSVACDLTVWGFEFVFNALCHIKRCLKL